MFTNFQSCFEIRKSKLGKNKIDIEEYNKKEHGILYLCISPFQENKLNKNFRKGDLFTIDKDDEKFLVQYQDFYVRLNKTEIMTLNVWDKSKKREPKFKLPKNASKKGYKFPLKFTSINILNTKWEEIEKTINQEKLDRKYFVKKNSVFARKKLEMENFDLKNQLADLKKQLVDLDKIKKDIAELKKR